MSPDSKAVDSEARTTQAEEKMPPTPERSKRRKSKAEKV
jgi:hypothetical protein